MKITILKKWRKNWQMAAILFTFIPVFCLCYISAYINIRKDPSFLIIIFVLVILFIILLVSSFKGWNEFLYMDEDKIWTNRKGEQVKWRYDEVIMCRIIAKPRWTNNYCVEISIKTSNQKLVFACNNKIEKLLLKITKGKEV